VARPESSREQELLGHYDHAGRARAYRDRFRADRTHRAADRAERGRIRALLDRIAPIDDWVLDLPCGAGRFHDLLESRSCPFVAADISRSMLELVRERPEPGRRGCVGASVLRPPFRDGAFDGALCIRLLHHFATERERVELLRALRRVVRRFAIVSFFDAHSLQALRRRWRSRFRGRPSARFAQTLASLRREARAAAFRVDAVSWRARAVSEWAVALLVATPRRQ